MPQRNVASNFTFEQQRVEINELAADFWTQKGTVDTAASTYLKHDGSNAFSGGTLNVPNAFTIASNSGAGTVTINANLQVQGTTTTLNSTTLEVADKHIVIAKGSANDGAANGAGIIVDSATDRTFTFVDGKNAFVSSIGLEATTGVFSNNVDIDGNLDINDTSQSSNTTTGALVVDGGVGIAKNLNVGGWVTATSASAGGNALLVTGLYDGSNPNVDIQTWQRTGGGVQAKLIYKDATTDMFFGTDSAHDFTLMTGGVGRTKIFGADGKLVHTANKASDYLAEFHQAHANNSAQILLNSPADNNTRPASIDLANDGTVKWSLGQAYSSTAAGAFHIATSVLQSNENGAKLTIRTDGHVGIGTVNPSQLLEINGANSPCVLLKDTTNDVIAYLFADDSNAFVGSASNHPVIIKQNNGTAIHIDTSKNVSFNGTLDIPAVVGTNTNADLAVLFQTSAGVIDGGSGLTYNPGGDALKVNGLVISQGGINGNGNSLNLSAANHSSTCSINVGSIVNVTNQLTCNNSGTSAKTAGRFENLTNDTAADCRVQIATFSNGGGDAFIHFDTGGSNMLVGNFYGGTTNNKLILGAGDSPSGTVKGFTIDGNGHVAPTADNTYNLGSASNRWANVYTGDMHLNNMNTGGNEVDGSEGHWTMQEGSDDLFLINRNTGKKYKFNLTEVS